MSKQTKRSLCFCAALFALFLIWTVAVKTVDVQPIGPEGSEVGLATVNRFMLQRTSGAPLFERISDWAGYFALAIVFGLAVYGLVQWIRRKDVRKVDSDLLIAGGTYLLTGLFYALFEFVVVNYRPVLEKGKLAASYPSSHTVLVLVVLLTFVMLLDKRITNRWIFHLLSFLLDAVAVVTVLFREQAGIHWFTDIIGGMLLGGALIMLFHFASEWVADRKAAKEYAGTEEPYAEANADEFGNIENEDADWPEEAGASAGEAESDEDAAASGSEDEPGPDPEPETIQEESISELETETNKKQEEESDENDPSDRME